MRFLIIRNSDNIEGKDRYLHKNVLIKPFLPKLADSNAELDLSRQPTYPSNFNNLINNEKLAFQKFKRSFGFRTTNSKKYGTGLDNNIPKHYTSSFVYLLRSKSFSSIEDYLFLRKLLKILKGGKNEVHIL